MHVTRRAALLGATALAACQTPQPGSSEAWVEFGGVLDEISTAMLREAPQTATSLGVTEEQAGGRFVDRLNDLSAAGKARRVAMLRESLTKLRATQRATLTETDRVTYDVVETSLQSTLDHLRFPTGIGAMVPYTVTQLNGAYTDIPDFLDSRHPLTNRDQADAYLTRLAGFARQMDQENVRIGEDAAAGVIPADFMLDKAILQLENFTQRAPGQTVLVQSFARRLGEVAAIGDADKAAMRTRAEAIVRDEVFPAYARQIAALRALRPRAVHDAGCWRLPNGEELYAVALRSRTTTTLSPDEIHNMGVELVNALQSEMDAILRAQGLTQGSVAERVRVLSTRPDQLYPNTDAGREQVLADLNAQTREIEALMPRVCGVLARAPLEIRRVPPYIEAGAPGGYYQRASIDGSRPGAYYINLRDTAEWPKFTLPTLNYHEGVPGHHWQISIQQESGSLPFIRSALLSFTAFNEGWGLYAEQVADELGVYANNPLGRLGMLQSAAFRASRLVVDTGMHAKRWSREQAIQSMLAATGDQESSITTEIERYAAWPGQACAYMVGRQEILRQRSHAQSTQGARFDIKAFHDHVLTNGSVPLTVLEANVSAWLAARG